MTSADACLICASGTYCPIGSENETACAQGTFNALEGKAEACDPCPSGQFQDVRGQTSCKRCNRGSHCEVGAAKPTPCPAGTASNATGVASADGCVPVAQGYWAPLGSAIPEDCPASGFYCPGAAEDELYGGAKPIIMPVGGSMATEQVEVVEQEMTLTIDCATFDLAVFRRALATEYQVAVALIEVDDPCGSPDRRPSRRVLQQTISITVSIASSGTMGDGTPVTVPVANLLTAVSTTSDSALGSLLTLALGVPISVVSAAPVTASVTKTMQLECPKGRWCTAGVVVPCPLNTYNPLSGQHTATACTRCPVNAFTLTEASTSADDCMCSVGFFDALFNGSGVDCRACPLGTDCQAGETIASLPLAYGYYRVSNATTKVRPCYTDSFCPNANGSACADGHSGTFCEGCLPSYHRSSVGGCTLCEGDATFVAPLAMLLFLILLSSHACLRARTMRRMRAQAALDKAIYAPDDPEALLKTKLGMLKARRRRGSLEVKLKILMYVWQQSIQHYPALAF